MEPVDVNNRQDEDLGTTRAIVGDAGEEVRQSDSRHTVHCEERGCAGHFGVRLDHGLEDFGDARRNVLGVPRPHAQGLVESVV